MVADRKIAGAAGAIRTLISVAVLVAFTGCSRSPAPDAAAVPLPSREAPTASSPVTFVNQVWEVKRSSAVAPGTLYVFLSDGTLVVAASGGKPMVGSWSRSGDDLEMVEESIPYRVEVLGLTADTFSIRSHNPGEPVDIVMVRAGTR